MSTDGTAGADKTAFHLVDFGATLAADEKVSAAVVEAIGEEAPELLSMDLLLDGENDAEIIDVGEETRRRQGT